MGRLVLCSSEGNPVVQLLDLDSGEVTPVPSPMDGGGGALHIWVPPDDLLSGDLSRCTVQLDSH